MRRTLLSRWQDRGERGALDRLLAIELGEIKRILRSRTSSPACADQASDFAQSAVRRLLDHRSPPRFSSADGLRAYLVRTAQNRFYESLKAAGRANQAATRGVPTAHSGGLGAIERGDAVRRALPRLDAVEREVIDLQFFQGLSRAEVCQRLGISKQTASDRTLRALEHLKRILGR